MPFLVDDIELPFPSSLLPSLLTEKAAMGGLIFFICPRSTNLSLGLKQIVNEYLEKYSCC